MAEMPPPATLQPASLQEQPKERHRFKCLDVYYDEGHARKAEKMELDTFNRGPVETVLSNMGILGVRSDVDPQQQEATLYSEW